METQIISYNVKGLQSSVTKGNKIFHYLKVKKINIAMLQETHSKTEDETMWTKEWGGEIVFSHGSSSSRGACIIVRTLRASRGHLMNKDSHLFYYVPGSHSNNKIDVANHGNVADIFWTPFSKWPPLKLVKLHFRL